MKRNKNLEYLTPEVSIQQMEQNGVLCSSTGFGTAITDDFTIGEDISDIF